MLKKLKELSKEQKIIGSIVLLLILILFFTLLTSGSTKHSQVQTKANDSVKQSSQVKQSSSSSSTSSSSSSSSTSTTSSSSTEDSIIDTTAEELRDMENDGRLKTGQRYRFTAELTRKKFWESYVGHFKALDTYHTIWVKASNAPITGVQVQIKKSMIEDGKKEQPLLSQSKSWKTLKNFNSGLLLMPHLSRLPQKKITQKIQHKKLIHRLFYTETTQV